MVSSRSSKPVPIAQRRAAANLLRLADACLRDAQLLSRSGRLSNVAMLVGSAVARMVEALVVSQRGRVVPAADVGSESLDDENPVKTRLTELEAGTFRGPLLDDTGRLPKSPDDDALQNYLDLAATVLAEISRHFDVDLSGDDPAGNVEPMQSEPVAPASSSLRPEAARLSRRTRPSKTKDIVLDAASRPQTRDIPGVAIHSGRPASDISSVVFWSLMDRWKVADLDALALLGHAAGITRKGTRPRFKPSEAEADMLIRLGEIDEALISAKLDPREWLRKPVAAAPFRGVAPLAFITQSRLPGARAVSHYIFQQGLRLSLTNC